MGGHRPELTGQRKWSAQSTVGVLHAADGIPEG